jgi:hypothetical protein
LLNKYWNSPAIALTIKRSRHRRKFYLVLAGSLGLSIYLVFSVGYGLLATCMALLAIYCLRRLHTEPLCGASIGWRQGQWLIFSQGDFTAVELLKGSVVLPWLIRLTLKNPLSGCSHIVVLFSDSAEPRALQRLRRRLVLQR